MLTICLAALCLMPPGSGKVIIGYVQDEPEAATIVDQTDYSKISILDIAFANPTNAQGDLLITPHLDQLVARAHKNHVRAVISIGGGFVSEDKASRERYLGFIGASNRSWFVRKLASYVDFHALDGIDVDLEGPAITADYEPFVLALSDAMRARHKLLTAAVSQGNGGDQITQAALDRFNYVNVMAYDATGPWNPKVAGQHSSFEFAKQCASYWMGRVTPKSRIVLGVPFYGYGFGPAFTQAGYTYAQIMAKFPGAERADQVGNTIWYNGIPTIQAKAKFVVDQGLGGVMIWSIDQDVPGTSSLLAAVHRQLFGK